MCKCLNPSHNFPDPPRNVNIWCLCAESSIFLSSATPNNLVVILLGASYLMIFSNESADAIFNFDRICPLHDLPSFSTVEATLFHW